MSLSPMMQQYHDAKQAVGDALLLFRMGDFYELFHEDAKTAARVLGLSLTSRDKGENPIPMAGFPHHQLDQYLAKIIRSGHRAAICEQLEDPKQAKGIVKRDVTRIVSSGTLTDDSLLDPRASNYLAAVCTRPKHPDRVGVAWVELSTGRFSAAQFSRGQLADELARIAPSECLVAEGLGELVLADCPERMAITTRPAWSFGRQAALDVLGRQFGSHALEGFGFTVHAEDDPLDLAAAGAILEYLIETQKSSLEHIERLLPYAPEETLQIDSATWRSLEITQTLRDGRRETALLGVIDRTVTGMGARLLADWLCHPLTDVAAIDARLDAVGELVQHTPTTTAIRQELTGIYDLERLLARVTTGRASPRDLSFVGRTLAVLPKIKAKLTGRASPKLVDLEGRIDLCGEVRGRLEQALVENCPLNTRDGGFIRAGFHPPLDELRELMVGGKQWMARYQAAECERTGIGSMKVGFNSVFGYYLEVTHTHRDKVPPEYIRKQTLKNAERYVTPELKEYEEKVLSAEERAKQLELRLFTELRDLVASASKRILSTAAALAELDVLTGLADLATSRNYIRPTVVAEPVLEIEEGRHPVLDALEAAGTFVPNDCRCAGGARDGELGAGEEKVPNCQTSLPSPQPPAPSPSLLLITGPNMAGKSTYIRQTALLVLLAQIGSFVPARRAIIGVADRLFARVGASDELSRGQSTFMVEMTETARILNTATHRSVVILDEIGRGTSTYDGLSLAWSIVEYLHDRIGCRALFATHYHELTDLAGELPGVANLNVAVEEHAGKVVFLHRIVPGAADKSYGIHVAELAGVPREVNRRAAEILAQLEAQHHGRQDHVARGATASAATPRVARNGHALQLTLFEQTNHPLLEEIRTVDVNQLTPMEALMRLQAWQEKLTESP
ncbi:MAG: DNA mismatch repair protein MutS [Pirellulales bacterium]